MIPLRSADEWAREWGYLQKCPHIPPHDTEEGWETSKAYNECLGEFFRAYAAEQVAQARVDEREACAKFIEEAGILPFRREIAAAIRARP